ncbi:hypothetical protein BV898_13215 [Hypsibius exemplaris]|uniref:Ig-like domain-containing protein n=1 Tax=Hypsibius exemplaris TaxID=2072580 RepID=A0A1W0WBA1_HYPEX|nr:hypothetical protein BV898_13215 [Hypsibius exemplaris]
MVRVIICRAICLLLLNVPNLASAKNTILIGEGSAFNLTCHLPGHMRPDKQIQWTFADSRLETKTDDYPIILSSWFIRKGSTIQLNSIPDRYAASIKISSVPSGRSFDIQVGKASFFEHNGIYRCEEIDTRRFIPILINFAEVIVTSPPIFTVTETNVYGNTSDPTWLRLMVDGNPAPAVSCKHRDQQLIAKSGRTEGSLQRSTMQPIVHKHKTIVEAHCRSPWFLTATGTLQLQLHCGQRRRHRQHQPDHPSRPSAGATGERQGLRQRKNR